MLDAEYELVCLLHKLAYSEEPVSLDAIRGKARIPGLELALARGVVQAQHTDKGSYNLSLTRNGNSFIGKTDEGSVFTRFANWLSATFG